MSISVLIIDDSTPILEMLKFALATYRPTIVSAHDGKEALALARNNAFDLIISDVEMPKMNGVAFGVELRKFNSKTPIIFYSAYDKFSSEIQAELVKMDGITLITDKNIDKLLSSIGAFMKSLAIDSSPFKK